MDECYEMFLSELGPQFVKVQLSPHQIAKFEGRLPEQLLEYWKLYGWSGYYDGLFWLVNPDDYVSVVNAWLEGAQIENRSDYLAIARTAFGRIFLWNKKSGQNVTIVPLDSQIITSPANKKVVAGDDTIALQSFLIGKEPDRLDIEDVKEKKLFKRALKKLGPVAVDEMYGFEPALCIGGMPVLENIKKVKIIEHLILLEQLGEIEIMHIDVSRHL
ncbi:GAD-like domain-containing protein [Duganella sp. CF517]|uniref:GAD-like domain-containing protein n=1 Tax=Duganella sp. CF517 TaxID=1881038 RepID=UPI0015A725F0|nr:GAD-like domain-containing protein [Duganella sp. CF517]